MDAPEPASHPADPGSTGSAARMPGRDLVVLAAFGVAVVGGLAWWVLSARGTRPRRVAPWTAGTRDPRLAGYVGDRACAECHPGEAAAHQRAGHSRTLRPAAAGSLARCLNGRRVADPEQPGVSWVYELRAGKLAVTRQAAGQSQRLPIEYAFGSGHHAVTFLTLQDPDPAHPVALEHRLTYFTATRSLEVTPGQPAEDPREGTTPLGRVLRSEKAWRCFHCHTTVTSAEATMVLDESSLIPGVSCERCHGPARKHIEAARAGAEDLVMPYGPGRWTAAEQMRLCGECHRHPSQAPRGQVRPDNTEIVRFQPVGLMQSACYRQSAGKLSCVTCHDPHARASTDRAGYEAKCLECHQAPAHRECSVSPRANCLECHMPRHDAGQGILFTDHWIRVRAPARSSLSSSAPGTTAPTVGRGPDMIPGSPRARPESSSPGEDRPDGNHHP